MRFTAAPTRRSPITGNKARKTRGGPYMSGVSFAPAPYVYRNPFNTDDPEIVAERCAEMVEWAIQYQSSGDVAAFIAEPIMGEGGIIVPPASYFKRVKEVLDANGILFIADEVQSGFGRTGKMFGIEHFGVEPDIMVMAKGIADGFPLSATIARAEIADSLRPGEHLSTFGGNPISCAAAIANIQVMEEEQLPEASARKGERLIDRLWEMQSAYPMIGDVRGLGLMIGVELVTDRKKKTPAGKQAAQIRKRCREEGVLVGVGGQLGNVIRFQPPLVISDSDLDRAVSRFSTPPSPRTGKRYCRLLVFLTPQRMIRNTRTAASARRGPRAYSNRRRSTGAIEDRAISASRRSPSHASLPPLPTQFSGLFGRQAEVDQLVALIRHGRHSAGHHYRSRRHREDAPRN